MLDELRSSLDDDLGFDDDLDESEGVDFGEDEDLAPQRFLGMTAGERAFLSVMLFLNVLVLGVAVLVATGRIG